MIGLHQTKGRISDLELWSTNSLKRRLKLEADMRRALSRVGYRSGTHEELLSLDITIIGRVLGRRGIN